MQVLNVRYYLLWLDNFTCYPYQIRIKLLHIPISHLGFYINTNNCLILTCKQCKVTSNIRLGPNHDGNSLKQIVKHTFSDRAAQADSSPQQTPAQVLLRRVCGRPGHRRHTWSLAGCIRPSTRIENIVIQHIK